MTKFFRKIIERGKSCVFFVNFAKKLGDYDRYAFNPTI